MNGRLSVLGLVVLVLSCSDSPAVPDPSASPHEPLAAPVTPVTPSGSDDGGSCYRMARRLDRLNLQMADRTADSVTTETVPNGSITRTRYYGVGWTSSPGYADAVTREVYRGTALPHHEKWIEGVTHQIIRWDLDGSSARVKAWGGRDLCNTLGAP